MVDMMQTLQLWALALQQFRYVVSDYSRDNEILASSILTQILRLPSQ